MGTSKGIQRYRLIKEKNYGFGLEKYKGDVLLVGINYDEITKEHTCIIEKYEKKRGN